MAWADGPRPGPCSRCAPSAQEPCALEDLEGSFKSLRWRAAVVYLPYSETNTHYTYTFTSNFFFTCASRSTAVRTGTRGRSHDAPHSTQPARPRGTTRTERTRDRFWILEHRPRLLAVHAVVLDVDGEPAARGRRRPAWLAPNDCFRSPACQGRAGTLSVRPPSSRWIPVAFVTDPLRSPRWRRARLRAGCGACRQTQTTAG